MRFAVGAASDVGRRRTVNEDCALVSERVVAVADGMGGHAGGEVASAVAIEALRAAMVDPDVETLSDAVTRANTAVWDQAADPDLRGMGTTLCALALVGPDLDGDTHLALTNVGDSRVYAVTDGGLQQLTEDHSLVEGLVREGRITSEEAALHPHRNVVTRVLGMAEDVQIDAWDLEPVEGDRYLLCSDGLFNEVDEARIAATLRRLADPQEAAHELVRQANESGGRDNVTVVVVDLVEGPAGEGTDVTSGGERVVRPGRSATGDVAGFTAMAASAAPDGDESAEVGDRPRRSMLPRVAARPGEPGTRRVTWRTAAFLAAILAVFGVAAAAVVWYGTSGYFVSIDDDGEIAVFEGRPGGFLWFEPSLVESTGVDADELTPVLREQIDASPQFGSFGEAEAYLANLADQLERSGAGGAGPFATTSTTTATTTVATGEPSP